jgi:hypothetical protein
VSRPEATEQVSTPPRAGWYHDEANGCLRLWDGSSWTDRTRPAPTPVLAPTPGPGGDRPARRLHPAVEGALLLGAVAVVVLLVSLVAGRPSSARRPAASALDCTLPRARPSATQLVAWLQRQGLATEEQATSAPNGACDAAAFIVSGSPGTSRVVVHPTYRSASAAASGPAVVRGLYVVTLAGSLRSRRSAYQQVLDRYVTLYDPTYPKRPET